MHRQITKKVIETIHPPGTKELLLRDTLFLNLRERFKFSNDDEDFFLKLY